MSIADHNNDDINQSLFWLAAESALAVFILTFASFLFKLEQESYGYRRYITK
jgi:hypothetical protein